MPALIVFEGADRQRSIAYEIKHAVYAIGRGMGGRIQVTEEHVSRKHCSIRYFEQTQDYRIRDTGSKNGTKLNEKPIGTEFEPLEFGSTIMLGDEIELKFTAEVPADAVQPELEKNVGLSDSDTIES